MTQHTSQNLQTTDNEWIAFPGGELEGKRPKTLCPACRERLKRASAYRPVERPRTLCFQCYRSELDRERALKTAGQLDTASAERFQSALPFDPVNEQRLAMLKVEHTAARAMQAGVGRFAGKQRQAQIAARHALQASAASIEERPIAGVERERVMASTIHVAELQLPEAWFPFVIARRRMHTGDDRRGGAPSATARAARRLGWGPVE